MKITKVLFTSIFLICLWFTNAQQVEGNITVNNDDVAYLKIGDIAGESQVVDLFKAFKQKDYEIHFNFQGNYPPQQDKTEFTFFKFRTTVKHNGKTIKTLDRDPMPYIPGDMWLSAETFDFVTILSMYGQESMAYQENTGAMPEGEYEIILEAIPMEAEGAITKGLIMFNVK